MLENQGSDPHIVGWDGRALLPQLAVNGCVVMRRLLIAIEHADAGLQQKAAEDGFVAGALGADGKSSTQFSENDEGEPDLIGALNGFDDRSFTAAKVGIAVGVESELHRHMSFIATSLRR
jgi:hypothetical protein